VIRDAKGYSLDLRERVVGFVEDGHEIEIAAAGRDSPASYSVLAEFAYL